MNMLIIVQARQGTLFCLSWYGDDAAIESGRRGSGNGRAWGPCGGGGGGGG